MDLRRICYDKPWYFQLNYLAIFAFMIVLQFVTGFGVRPLMVMGLSILAVSMQFNQKTSLSTIKTPNSLKFYWLWGIWAITTGLFLFVSAFDFFDSAKMLIRNMVFIWVLFAIFCRQRQHGYFYFLLLLIAGVQVLASGLGYHVINDAVSNVGGDIVRDQATDEFSRIEGLTGNANAMGSVLLAGIWSGIMLWRNRTTGILKGLSRCLLVFAICVFSYYIIRTASRKSLLVVAVLLMGWAVWLMPGRFSFKSLLVSIFMGILFLVVGWLVLQYLLPDTMMAKRFREWFDAGGGSAAEGFKQNVRYWMYVDGFKMFLRHPICGVGLNQFRAHHWSGLYSHSDFMEPLACTGLIGFILYQGFAFSILMRIVRLIRIGVLDSLAYNLKGMLLFMICNHYLIGLGCPWWYIIDHTVILMFIGTYAWRIEQEVVKHRYIYAT